MNEAALLTATIRQVVADRPEGVRVIDAVIERLGGAEAARAGGIALAEAVGFVVNPGFDPPLVRLCDYFRLDPAAQLALFDGGRHVRAAHRWLVLAGRHYDAECPEGVDHWHQLPLFRRLAETSGRGSP